jgi:hypothetical protein
VGYRSEWKLVIVAADINARDLVLRWMFDYSTMINVSIPDSHRPMMETILQCELERTINHVMFGDNSTKCYPPWDDVIADIREYVNMNPELDMGYARVGEDYDDIETECGDKYLVSAQIVRTVDGFDFEIPGKAKPATAAPVAKLQEEKCVCCGKMKDVGQKCWWCGK